MPIQDMPLPKLDPRDCLRRLSELEIVRLVDALDGFGEAYFCLVKALRSRPLRGSIVVKADAHFPEITDYAYTPVYPPCHSRYDDLNAWMLERLGKLPDAQTTISLSYSCDADFARTDDELIDSGFVFRFDKLAIHGMPAAKAAFFRWQDRWYTPFVCLSAAVREIDALPLTSVFESVVGVGVNIWDNETIALIEVGEAMQPA